MEHPKCREVVARETSRQTPVVTHLFRFMNSDTEKRLRGVSETECGRFDCLVCRQTKFFFGIASKPLCILVGQLSCKASKSVAIPNAEVDNTRTAPALRPLDGIALAVAPVTAARTVLVPWSVFCGERFSGPNSLRAGRAGEFALSLEHHGNAYPLLKHPNPQLEIHDEPFISQIALGCG